ncbi:Pentatricopeptide repeat-containing protein [Planoprotostelium fungivorum]|uniref:Pentatricopeptide repeat-containing protein n=1 Tax=Planoprotostelium fungivorum TaxID=1890364 RepID=A0A2P6NBJ2_9EUKA|nr:Pentatricopeptide repeat-containing protein [Planoprotostelium fungivorum]
MLGRVHAHPHLMVTKRTFQLSKSTLTSLQMIQPTRPYITAAEEVARAIELQKKHNVKDQSKPTEEVSSSEPIHRENFPSRRPYGETLFSQQALNEARSQMLSRGERIDEEETNTPLTSRLDSTLQDANIIELVRELIVRLQTFQVFDHSSYGWDVWNGALLLTIEGGDYPRVKQIYTCMRNDGVKFEPVSFGRLLVFFRRNIRGDDLVSCLQDYQMLLTHLDASTMGRIVRAYGDLGDVASIHRVIAEFTQEKVAISGSCYVKIITSLLKNDALDDANTYMRKMEEEKYEPGPIVLSAFLKYYSDRRDTEQVLYWLSVYDAQGYERDVITYNMMIQHYANTRDEEKTWEWLRSMVKSGLQPTDSTYNTLLGLYIHTGDRQGVETVLKRMEQAGIERDVITYCLIAKANVYNKDTKELFRTLAEMERRKIKPNLSLYKIVITWCISVSRHSTKCRLKEFSKK